MNDDRQIAAESRQIFIFFALLNSAVTVPIFTKISQVVVALL